MPGDLCIEALGVPIRVRLGDGIDAESAAHLHDIWAAARGDGGKSGHVYSASIVTETSPPRGDLTHVVGRDLRSLESTLSARITLAAIEERKHDLIMLHGCAVAREDGSVYAFVGPSGRGKSTLARSLAEVAQYVSDETVGIDENGQVLPHPKPLSIIDPAAPDGLKTQVAPTDLGRLSSEGTRLHIERIFLLDRRTDASGVSVEQIDLADSLEHLVPQLSYLPSLPRPLQRIAELYERVGGFGILSYSEADDVVEAFLSGALDRRGAAWESTRVWFSEPNDAVPDEARTRSFGYRRLPTIDALETDERLCLLRGSSVTVLDGIGPTVWACTESIRSLDDLVTQVVAQHGEPHAGEAAAIVAHTVSQLVEAGVLEEISGTTGR